MLKPIAHPLVPPQAGDRLFIAAVTTAGGVTGYLLAQDAPDPGTARGAGFICAAVGFAIAYLLTKLRELPAWLARRRYRRDLLSTLGTIMMEAQTEWPGLEQVLDLIQIEPDQWDAAEETAVLYAGTVLANRIEAIPDARRRQRIGENVREWLRRPDQFMELMSVAKAITSNERPFQDDELLQWHIQWALDYVRRLRSTNAIDETTQKLFVQKVWHPLFPDFVGRPQQIPETAYQWRSSD